MKHSILLLLTTVLLTACQSNKTISMPSKTTTLQTADNTTLIISYEAGKKDIALQAVKAMQGKVIYDYTTFNMLAVGFYAGDIEAVKAKLEKQPAILSVRRDYIQHALN